MLLYYYTVGTENTDGKNISNNIFEFAFYISILH